MTGTPGRGLRGLNGRRIRSGALLAAGAIFATLGALVLGGGGDSALAAAAPFHPVTMLAAGDSFSSGEGLPGATGTCAVPDSGSGARTYAQIAAQSPSIARPIVSVSCAGSGLGTLLAGVPAANGSSVGQWNSSLGRFDLVTFTFGGDDVDLDGIIRGCIGLTAATANPDAVGAQAVQAAGPSTPPTPTPAGTPAREPGRDRLCPRQSALEQSIDALVGHYGTWFAQLANEVVTIGGNVVVVGYPQPIADPARWQGLAKTVGLCDGVGTADATEIRALVTRLNSSLARAVTAAEAARTNGVHFTFLDVNTGGAGIKSDDKRLFEPAGGPAHSLCAGAPWLNGPSAVHAGAGSFHPDQAGHDATGALLDSVVNKSLDWTRVGLPPGATPLPTPSPSPTATPTPAKTSTPGRRTPTPTAKPRTTPTRSVAPNPVPAPTVRVVIPPPAQPPAPTQAPPAPTQAPPVITQVPQTPTPVEITPEPPTPPPDDTPPPDTP